MNEESLSTKAIIQDISCMHRVAVNLLDRGKEYDGLLRHILDENYYYDQHKRIPAIKDLLKEMGLSYGKIKRLLEMIYQDLLDQIDPSLHFDFQEVEYHFIISFYHHWHMFKVKNLAVMPRVGEQVHVPFFKALVGIVSFHVKSIEHLFDDNKQIIRIDLKPFKYNLYWHYRLDEAVERREISEFEYIELDEYSLKKRLGVTPKWSY